MTSFQLLKGLTGIDSELLVSVEQQTNASKTKWSKSQSKHLSGKKIWLIAAVIVLAMLLVGCAVAYASGWFQQIFSARSETPLSSEQIQYIQNNEQIVGQSQT